MEVSVVSLAGVLSSDPGISRCRHLWHFYGRRDGTRPLGPILFPGRWPVAIGSRWNSAKRERRVKVACIGPMKHAEGRDYLDADATDAGGVPFRTLTIRALRQAIEATTDQA